ncbi:MAG: alpha/beta hydrolase domain-containing protein [Pseudonocardiaceae bacterium]
MLILLALVTLVAAGTLSAVAGPVRQPSIGMDAAGLPEIRGPLPVTRDSYPFNASDHDAEPIDLGRPGYIEQEYLVNGRANVYSWPDLDTLTVDASGAYTTRIIVRRPADPRRFSGNVRVEPLNPTAHHDLDVQWEIAHDAFMGNGDAYVGITVKPESITALKKFDPARYGSLSMANPKPPAARCTPSSPSSRNDTEDGLAWDVISQVGRLIKSDVPQNPLRGLRIRSSDLTGWSQSGSYTVIYLNAIARHATLPEGKPIFDGYLPGAGNYAGTQINQCAPVIPPGDPRVQYNPPGGEPVVILTTPTDFYSAASYKRLNDRPADSDTPNRRIRLYEIGGGCHLPADHARFFPSAAELAKAGFPTFTNVVYPLSSFPLHAVLDGAWANLDSWVNKGISPPHASRLTVADPAVWPVTAVKDAYGNAVGGIRTPAVDVPTATYVERGPTVNNTTEGYYAGYDIPFAPDYLKILYPTHRDYVRKVSHNVRQLIDQHWLTPYDGAQFVSQAEAKNVPSN